MMRKGNRRKIEEKSRKYKRERIFVISYFSYPTDEDLKIEQETKTTLPGRGNIHY